MTSKQKVLIDECIGLLPENEKETYRAITDYLAGLGYVPQKQSVKDFVLSFKHTVNGKSIAKIGIRKQKGFAAIKFYACKDVPAKYADALRGEIDSHGGQYCGPLRCDAEKNRCGLCGFCTGGGIGYYYIYPDGKEVVRCGAYPIFVPDVGPGDVAEMKRLLLEQHAYFQSIA